MDSIFTKLNYKEGQTMFVLNTPEIFENLLKTLPVETSVFKDLASTHQIDFILVFTTSRDELQELATSIYPRLKGDAIVWVAYPKGTSKKYICDFNRDSSWEILAPYNLMPVRQISIDEDWSALRFRKSEYIKSITRKQK